MFVKYTDCFKELLNVALENGYDLFREICEPRIINKLRNDFSCDVNQTKCGFSITNSTVIIQYEDIYDALEFYLREMQQISEAIDGILLAFNLGDNCLPFKIIK